jgi:Mn-containing catalase
VEQLRDILHAEKQLTKALPKMANRPVRCSSNDSSTHLEETEAQAERLNECLRLWALRLVRNLAKAWQALSKKARRCRTARKKRTPLPISA